MLVFIIKIPSLYLGRQKNWSTAIKSFEAAVAAEDTLRYSAPKVWRIPAVYEKQLY
ncbi:MAG: hypothetical protein ACR2KX_12055 [Chitinophagaceae bacterium]